MKRLLSIGLLLIALLPINILSNPKSCIKAPGETKGRPNYLPEVYYSESGIFALHYTNSGSDSVAQLYTLDAAVPDYIVLAGDYFDMAYQFITQDLGFMPPPVDQALSPEIDAYFQNLGNGNYGATVFESDVPTTLRANDWTAYMNIHNSFEGGGFFTNGIEALSVTCAHELFHVFQLGYNYWSGDDKWFLETSSSWIEDAVFPDVNDYFSYIANYSRVWGQPIMDYYYDNVGFNIFLEEKFPGFTIDVWTKILKKNVFESLDDYLSERYSDDSWAVMMAELGVSHLYCNDALHYGESYFPDARNLAPILYKAQNLLDFKGNDTLTAVLTAAPFSNQFYVLKELPSKQLKISLLDKVNSDVQLIVKDGANTLHKQLGSAIEYVSIQSESPEIIFSMGSSEGLNYPEHIMAKVFIEAGFTKLLTVYPNPLINNHIIKLDYSITGKINTFQIDIYNILGQRVNRIDLSKETVQDGFYTQTIPLFNPSAHSFASGVYILRISLNDDVLVKKITFIK